MNEWILLWTKKMYNKYNINKYNLFHINLYNVNTIIVFIIKFRLMWTHTNIHILNMIN